MKNILLILIVACTVACNQNNTGNETKDNEFDYTLREEVKAEFIRIWESYKKYAWGHDVLLPLSKGYHDWHEKSLHISPKDEFVFEDYIFNTEAHPFLKSSFKKEEFKSWLGSN